MKGILKAGIAWILAQLARAVLLRYRPKIVMVTGSVGKTSTKQAVALALSARYLVRESEKSFNSEFGVPYTIFGVANPWRNPLAWLRLAQRVLGLLCLPNHYPNMLVLEVGADHPGDIGRILQIARSDAVVVTRLPEVPVHVEFYASPEAVREEEFSPAYALPAGAPLIVSTDDGYALHLALRTPARVISYGTTERASVRLASVNFYKSGGTVIGVGAEVRVGDAHDHLAIEGVVGRPQILPLAAAIAAASAFDISLAEAAKTLKAYQPPPGRCRLFEGKNGSIIIDDSYNSSPAAALEALATLKSFPMERPDSAKASSGRRIAVLGDMLELGRYSVMEHERVGTVAAESADIVVAVGIRARAFVPTLAVGTPTRSDVGARGAQMHYENSRVAARELSDLPEPGDVILVKGSQSIRMERIVEALLAKRSDVANLTRQEREWKRKP